MSGEGENETKIRKSKEDSKRQQECDKNDNVSVKGFFWQNNIGADMTRRWCCSYDGMEMPVWKRLEEGKINDSNRQVHISAPRK